MAQSLTPCQACPNYVQAVTFGGAPEPGPLAAAQWPGLHLNLPSWRGRAAAAATIALRLVTASEYSVTNILQALTRTWILHNTTNITQYYSNYDVPMTGSSVPEALKPEAWEEGFDPNDIQYRSMKVLSQAARFVMLSDSPIHCVDLTVSIVHQLLDSIAYWVILVILCNIETYSAIL